jgi:DNA polymerase III alpha subunit
LLLTAFSVGIGVGSLLCERLSRGAVEPGLAPIGALGMALCAADLGFISLPPVQAGIGAAEFLAGAVYWRVLLDDATAPLEVVVFSETLDAYRDWIKEDELLIVEGKVSDDAYSGGLRVTADKVYDLAHARNRFARLLHLSCNGQSNGAKLKEILAPYRSQEGGCPVTIAYHNGKAACEVSLGGAWQVQLHEHLIETLGQWLEPASVQVRY